MRKLQLPIAFLITFNSINCVYSQSTWVQCIVTSTNYTFNDIFFVNQNTGYCAGTQGSFFKTTNSGLDWGQINLGSSNNLTSISFINENTGYVTGSNGLVFKTTNAGINWINISIQTIYNINSIEMLNDTGWVVGGANIIYKTTNGGAYWEIQTAPTGPNGWTHDFLSVCFLNSQTGYASGFWSFSVPHGGYWKGTGIVKTTNGGSNWAVTFNEWDLIGYRIDFINSQTGYLSSRDITKGTTNGGGSWFPTYLLYSEMYDVEFINGNTGWVIGKVWSNIGIVCKTTNAGNNWFLQLYEYTKPFRTIFNLDSLNIWVAGEKSSVYKTTDGGGIISAVNQNTNEIPSGFILSQNYPNPFNPSTKIKFDIPKGAVVKLRVYDILGREVAELVNEKLNPGVYEYDWNGVGLPSGVYFYRLEAGEFIETRRMVLIK